MSERWISGSRLLLARSVLLRLPLPLPPPSCSPSSFSSYIFVPITKTNQPHNQVPLVNGYLTFQKLTRPDFIPPTNALFASDRAARARGEEAATIPVVDQNPLATSALPTADSYTFFTPYEKSCGWKNVVTVRSVEALRAYVPEVLIHAISPSPLFMAVARNDVLTTPDLSLAAYSRALEPKELLLLPGGHFDAYSGEDFEINSRRQVDFLGRTLCEKAGRVQGNY
jgi:hypothetical protein